jgi:signal transduction histidine kinase
MHLETADVSFPDDLSTLQFHIDLARRTARENLVEARRLLWALQPAVLDRASLMEALTALTKRWSEESGVTASATITGTPQALRPEIEVTLLRAAQEALANARKHAQANQLSLTLSYIDETVALDVQDDGVGFDPSQLCISPVEQHSGGFGLKSLRERVEQLGGTLSIESAPGEGTTIAVALPALSKPPSLPIELSNEFSNETIKM